MGNQDFKEMVREALQVPKACVENLGIAGGMTNLNYLVSVDGEEYIVRIPGHGTSSLIDREQERQNLELGSTLGINPQLLYFNNESGIKITRRIAGSDFYEGFEEVKKDIEELQLQYLQVPTTLAPCHIDPAPSNFLVDGQNKLYLIDWEYGGMFDPLWDIAAFSLESNLTAEQEDFFYQTYFSREITEEEERKLQMHQIFQDYLWSIWTLFKEESGDQFGLYGRHRFERLKENIHQYKVRYGPHSNAQ